MFLFRSTILALYKLVCMYVCMLLLFFFLIVVLTYSALKLQECLINLLTYLLLLTGDAKSPDMSPIDRP